MIAVSADVVAAYKKFQKWGDTKGKSVTPNPLQFRAAILADGCGLDAVGPEVFERMNPKWAFEGEGKPFLGSGCLALSLGTDYRWICKRSGVSPQPRVAQKETAS